MADLATKKQHYINEINKIAKESFNDEQKELVRGILNAATEANIDSIYTFVTQRVKTGFVFDVAPEVAHNCISLCERDNKKSFGNESGIHHKLIIGENYDVLKNLVATYTNGGKGLIDVIYIDPPYNTEKTAEDGNDYKTEVKSEKFVYRDKFSRVGWLNMMKERLELARKLLSNQGVIFISIDDNEQAYLKVLCDEIFGENNFVACFPRKTGAGAAATNSDSELRKPYDFILCYVKSKKDFSFSKKIVGTKEYKYEDEKGRYTLGGLQATGSDATRAARPKLYYPIYVSKDGKLSLVETKGATVLLPKQVNGADGRWMWSKEKFETDVQNLIYEDGKLHRKIYFDENADQTIYQVERAYFDESCYSNSNGTKTLKSIFGKIVFNNPKPVELIKKLISLNPNKKSIVLDFFGGSGTTAQAVMELNAEDDGNRQCILCTNNENNIADNITYERLYRVINGKGTKKEKFDWIFTKDKPYLTDNYIDVFNTNYYELQIDDYEKSQELLDKAKVEFKKLNSDYEFHDLDIYNHLASLKPYKKN